MPTATPRLVGITWSRFQPWHGGFGDHSGRSYAASALQSALIQDGGHDSRFSRLVTIDLTNSAHATHEYVYPMEAPTSGVNEILALDSDRFLVLERDTKAGPKANLKALFLIHLKNATDVSERGTAPSTDSRRRPCPSGFDPSRSVASSISSTRNSGSPVPTFRPKSKA